MKTNLNLKNHHFLNLPKPLKESDYQEVCNLVVSRLRGNSNIKSIYLVGSQSVFGISDLDILVICKDKINYRVGIPSSRSLSEKAKYIFLHNFWKLNEDGFRNVHYITPYTPLKLLWGKEIPIRNPQNELSQKDYQLFNAILIFDFLINKLLIFPRYLKYTQLDTRQILGEVYSLTYTLDMLKSIGLSAIQTSFPERIKKLREEWFDNDNEKNLQELVVLFDQAIDIIPEMVVRLNSFVQDQDLVKDGVIFRNRKYYIVFNKSWSKQEFLNSFTKGYIAVKKPFSKRMVENFKIILPESLSYFLLSYAKCDGYFSDQIRKSLINCQITASPINQGIYRHIKATNELARDSVNNNGFFKIPLSYGYLLGQQQLISYLGDKTVLFLRKIKK